ncbi:MAG TPA: HEXXH motif-containing putative peptide modification protein, partial [Segetibacter sp.]
MELATQIRKFIERPYPLWETTLTSQLAQHKWKEFERKGFQSFSDYSTDRFLLGDLAPEIGKKKEIADRLLYVEMPSFQLQSFYDEHGLELLTENEIEVDAALLKLNKAFSVLRNIEPAYDCISLLVRSIHILRQADVEIDLSYSHPNIPFSIFVSVCADDSTISNLRVAESILHEAMHLKLTLIENFIPLVRLNTNSTFYSPWRDEERPVRGVLHGLFVFTAIIEFYKELCDLLPEAENYICTRIS